MPTRPCSVCRVTIKVDSISHKYCGPACESLALRRASAKPGEIWYHPSTPEQVADHQDKLRKKEASY